MRERGEALYLGDEREGCREEGYYMGVGVGWGVNNIEGDKVGA